MASIATTTNLASSETVQTLYITALRNTHALEKQALQMMERQIERYQRYPEMRRILQEHARETEQQIQRLEDILHSHGEDRSLLKDIAAQLAGNLGAIGHALAGDEILKNLYADHALENYEIAAYTSLIAIAEAAGHQQHIPTLQQTLREEERAARMLLEQVRPVTMRYVELEAQGETAKR